MKNDDNAPREIAPGWTAERCEDGSLLVKWGDEGCYVWRQGMTLLDWSYELVEALIDADEAAGPAVKLALTRYRNAQTKDEADEAMQALIVTGDLVRDAARYRWLRNEAWGCDKRSRRDVHVCQFGPGVLMSAVLELAEEALDEAIDAAIAQAKDAG